ncbi:MAG: NnrS family protein [Gammaproteobacteria bacterium]|nr:NnrS family protein [Gammaproteobacteria bacterium]
MLNIEEPYPHKTAFLQLGFRPFFAASMAFAVLAIMAWMLFYLNGWSPLSTRYPAMLWHAHEMIFGYAMAVVAGFLLTAIRNWTNLPTLNNSPLLGLLLLWLAARLLPLSGAEALLPLAAILDLGFGLLLFFAALWPVARARQWKQAGIVSKLLLMFAANLAFYLGLFGVLPDGGRIGLYAGFYLILALILTMIRRLIPFFIEKGLDQPFQAKNNRWLDIASLVLFVLFAIADLVEPYGQLTAILAISQFFLHAVRLFNWHHPALWKKPLLWAIYSAYAWITLGFLLKALSIWAGFSPFIAVHSFAYGGIGMITLGMMTRVALGHTGRNVFAPPPQLGAIFLLLSLGAIFRIVVPIFDSTHYLWWVAIAQVFWILAFAATLIIYLPMLIRARIDGRPG